MVDCAQCKKPITSGDKRAKYCGRSCQHLGRRVDPYSPATVTEILLLWNAHWTVAEISARVKVRVSSLKGIIQRERPPPREVGWHQSREKIEMPGTLPGAWLTEDRRAVLTRDWPAGLRMEAIMAQLEVLPGPSLPVTKAVANRANLIGLRRPDGFRSRLAKDYPPPPRREGTGVTEANPMVVPVFSMPALRSADGSASLAGWEILRSEAEQQVAYLPLADILAYGDQHRVRGLQGVTARVAVARVNAFRVASHVPAFSTDARSLTSSRLL